MQNIEWVDAVSVDQAVQLLSTGGKAVMAKAGGIDLLDLMKEGILTPSRLVNLKTIPGLDEISFTGGELEIGALTTLARIAADPLITKQFPALSEAAGHAATPQVRNSGTLGGNLLQKPRCWYFRNEYFHHAETPGNPAHSGQNQYHAIFDNGETSMVHSSTPATALVAYNATIELIGAQGKTRTIPTRDFFLPASMNMDRLTIIKPGEVLTKVILPALPKGAKSAYHKQTERDSYDWPICDVAVVLEMQGDKVHSASIVMGWVAPTPRRATESESLLTGKVITEELASQAAAAAVKSATPLSKNAYKVAVLEAVVRRTILKAAGK
jgi:xanthine dehydrogenase YagS FAD-binding subunit